jgi:hypothetical protein
LWFLSPVWTLEWRARCPLVVNARSQVPQTCFFLAAGPVEGEVEVEEVFCGGDGDKGGEFVVADESGRYWELAN